MMHGQQNVKYAILLRTSVEQNKHKKAAKSYKNIGSVRLRYIMRNNICFKKLGMFVIFVNTSGRCRNYTLSNRGIVRIT
jgi:hypothetical protein